VVRWCGCQVAAEGAADIDDVLSRVRQSLLSEMEAAEERLLAVRLCIRGDCPDYRSTGAAHEELMRQCQAIANDLGANRIWLERTVIQLRAPLDLEQIAQRQDALGDLLRFIRTLPGDESCLRDLMAQFKPLHQKLPTDLRQGDDPLILDDPVSLVRLLPEVEQLLLPRLLETEVEA
jgi:hypothetical protein